MFYAVAKQDLYLFTFQIQFKVRHDIHLLLSSSQSFIQLLSYALVYVYVGLIIIYNLHELALKFLRALFETFYTIEHLILQKKVFSV